MILAVSVLSLNISQVKTSENELKYIQSELLTEGALAQILISQFSDTPTNTISYDQPLGNTTFSVSANIDESSLDPGGSESFRLRIDSSFSN